MTSPRGQRLRVAARGPGWLGRRQDGTWREGQAPRAPGLRMVVNDLCRKEVICPGRDPLSARRPPRGVWWGELGVWRGRLGVWRGCGQARAFGGRSREWDSRFGGTRGSTQRGRASPRPAAPGAV